MAAQDYEQLSYGAPAGAMLGKSASEKVGFWGVTPIIQPTNSAQAALTLTTATSGGFGFSTSAGFLAAIAQIENIRASLVLMGLLKGS
jgi:hypothetical protein